MRLTIPALICAAACSSAPKAELVTTDTLLGGTVRVMNHGPSEWADTNGWKLVLVNTIQPAQHSEGELLDPRYVLLREDGSFVVMESDPSQFKYFDASGTFVRNIGREGEGPGEYRDPFPVLLGDTLIIQDPRLSRISLISLQDSLIREFPSVCCRYGVTPTVDSNGHIAVDAGATDQSDRDKKQWTIFDLTGERVDSFFVPTLVDPSGWTLTMEFPGGGTGTTTFTIPLAAQDDMLRRRDGTIVYGESDHPVFYVTTNGIDTTAIFGRDDVVPDLAPASMRDSLFDRLVARNEKLKAVAKKSDIPTRLPIWIDLIQSGEGDLWVLTGGNGRPINFDVYSPSGVLRGTVPRPWSPPRSQSWAANKVAVLEIDDNDLPMIRIYQIKH